MLLQFYFSNYRSFEGNATLDMRAGGSNELASHVRVVGNDKILPIAAIYGANASGKSTVYSAFEFMSYYVVRSFFLSDDDVKEMDFSNFARKPYAMSDSKDKPSEFEVNFVISSEGREKYYNYGFIISDDGICEEWLKTNTKSGVFRNKAYKTVFYRNRNIIEEYDLSLSKFHQNLTMSLDEHVLLVSLGAKLKVKALSEIRDWFLANRPIDCSDFIYDSFLSKKLPKGVLKDAKAKNMLLDFMHSFDKSIVDFEFKKHPKSGDQKMDSYQIFAIHNFKNSTKHVKVSFDDESSGTIKMFSLYQIIRNVLDNGSILFSDELDIKLHPLLMRNIILTFVDPEKNPKNAQLIFTTHNTIYMEMDLLRRDEIWFVDKTDEVSELYSLGDFVDPNGMKVRKDSNYAKNYILGNYGAVPYLAKLFEG